MLRHLDMTRLCYAVLTATSIAGCSGTGGSLAGVPGTTVLSSSNHAQGSSAARHANDALTNTKVFSETPRSAFSLVNSVGIVTHFHYDQTPYVTQYSTVRNLLIGSHIRHIRDAITTADSFKPYFGYLTDLASQGIHVDGVTLMNEPLSTITAFATALPNVLESIEAPNEWNLSGDGSWVSDIRAYQKQLYSGLKSSSVTSSIPVIGPSLTSYEAYQAVGDLSPYLDQGNMHNYFGAENPGNPGGTPFPVGKYGSIPFFMGSAALVSGSKPITTTETGYEDLLSDPTPVSDPVEAKYVMRTVFEQFNHNVNRTFFYELVDEGGQSYGFVDPNLNPKPAYNAIKNLLYKLDDSNNAFTLVPLSYSLTADPSVHHTLLQKSDGSYRLILWIESTATDPTLQSQSVTINTAGKFGTVVQYDWQDSGDVNTTPLAQDAGGSIHLTVSDRVTELKLQK